MFQVIKRDGSKADFTLTKINDAIMKAFTATQMSYNNDIIDLLALRVTADFQKKVENDEIHVEDIQDSVERYWDRPAMKRWRRRIFCTASSGRKCVP